MSDSLTITDVTRQGVSAIVSFSDGHTAIFEGFTEGFGSSINYLRHFILRKDGERVAQFDSKLRRGGPYPEDHRFLEVADGYTIDRIVSYWEASWEHVLEEFIRKPDRENTSMPMHLGFPYHIMDASLHELQSIQAGHYPLPA